MRTVDRATCQRGNRADESDTRTKTFWGEKTLVDVPKDSPSYIFLKEKLKEAEIVVTKGKEIFITPKGTYIIARFKAEFALPDTIQILWIDGEGDVRMVSMGELMRIFKASRK